MYKVSKCPRKRPSDRLGCLCVAQIFHPFPIAVDFSKPAVHAAIQFRSILRCWGLLTNFPKLFRAEI
jgi:hypothetical protein